MLIEKMNAAFSAIPQYLLPATAHFLLKCPYNHTGERHHHDHVLNALSCKFLLAVHGLPDAPATHDI